MTETQPTTPRGKTAMITGGARRVGRVIAESLASLGMHLVLHYATSAREAESAAKEIAARHGVRVTLFQADLRDVGRLEHRLGEHVARHGAPDCLVNNASGFYETPLAGVTEAQWDDVMGSNLKGPFFLSRTLGLAMQQSGGGAMVFIGDWAVRRPYADYAPYLIAKAGVLGMTRVLARELAPQVRVNAVSPGAVLLPEGFTSEQGRELSGRSPLKRMGTPEDIARGVLFLLDGTDFATGTELVIDGGQSIG